MKSTKGIWMSGAVAFGALAIFILLFIRPWQGQTATGAGVPPTTNPSAGYESASEVHWRYFLAFVIAVMTGLGSIRLIDISFSISSEGKNDALCMDLGRVGLYMISVALIVEAVLICCILKVNVKQYEAIYAAIAGYVLGSLGRAAPSKRLPGGCDVSSLPPANDSPSVKIEGAGMG